MTCICGSRRAKEFERPYHEVTAEGVTRPANGHTFRLAECLDCGVIRQAKPPYKTAAEHEAWYRKYQPTGEAYAAKGYDHDRRIAALRADDYGISAKERILDVGSGSGAFVDECRARGAETYGCEIAPYADARALEYVYTKRLEDVHFPTDHFDRITCHDVLEHVVDPMAMLAEMFRALRPGGSCSIDYPRAHHAAGAHHWKLEHLWYLTDDQLRGILQRAGFHVIAITHPIESKTLIHATKPRQERPTILLPPGIGDSYWSMTKLRAFLAREKLGLPELHIACNREIRHSGHRRAFPFLEMFDFVAANGTTHEHGKDPELNALWREAYAQEGRTIFRDVAGCDFFISYNGHLRVGKQMEALDADLATEWRPPLFVSLEQERYRAQMQAEHGRYFCAYFVFQGTYAYWTKQFPVASVVDAINETARQTKATPVLLGAGWDAEEPTLHQVRNQVRGAVDLVGKTSVEQACGLMRGSAAVVGYPSGLTILSAVLGCPTLIVWNDYYNRQFAWYCAPPETRRKNYWIETTRGLTPMLLAEAVAAVAAGEGPEQRAALKAFEAPPEPVLLPAPAPKPAAPAVRTQPSAPPRSPAAAGAPPIRPTPPPVPIERAAPPVETSGVTIACVLKSGGLYTRKYVEILRDSLKRNLTLPYRFEVFTDVDMPGRQRLGMNLPGWWSKLELFRLRGGPVLYLDLDTIVMGDLNPLLRAVAAMPEGEFRMLTPFNPRRRELGLWASGLMAWHGDFGFLLRGATEEQRLKYRLDQAFICDALAARGVTVRPIDEFVEALSYKRHCKSGFPRGATAPIVCFHGKPGPEAAQAGWVHDHWRTGP